MEANRFRTALQAVVISYVLLLTGLAVHEVAHLVVLHLLGENGVLIIMPWRLGLANFYIYGLHVEPSRELTLVNQVIMNFSGPILAIIPFAALLYVVKEKILRLALSVNIAILVFFAVLESVFEVLETVLNKVPFLGSPEFNIGIPITMILITVYWRMWKTV